MAEKDGFKELLIEPLQEFARDSMHLVKKCTKPDRKEFMQIAKATATGFFIMGFIGFFVKLVHIPINNVSTARDIFTDEFLLDKGCMGGLHWMS